MEASSKKVEPLKHRKQKPPRLRSACNQCYAAKVKCSGERAGCTRCKMVGAECIYVESRVGKVQGPRSKKRRSELQQHVQEQQPQPERQATDPNDTTTTAVHDSIQALGFPSDSSISRTPQQTSTPDSPEPQSQSDLCNTDEQQLFSWNQPWAASGAAQWSYDDVQILDGNLSNLDEMILDERAADNNFNNNNENGHRRPLIHDSAGFELDFINGDTTSPTASSGSSISNNSSRDSLSREGTPAPPHNGAPNPSLLSPISSIAASNGITYQQEITQRPTKEKEKARSASGQMRLADDFTTHSPVSRSSTSSSLSIDLNRSRAPKSQQPPPRQPDPAETNKLNSRVILASVQILATLENYILADLRTLDLILEVSRKILAQMRQLIGLFCAPAAAEQQYCPNERCLLVLATVISQVIQLFEAGVGYSPSGGTDGTGTTITTESGNHQLMNGRTHADESINISLRGAGPSGDSIFPVSSSIQPLFGFGFGGGAFTLTAEEQTSWRSRVMRKEYRQVGEILSSLRGLPGAGSGDTRVKASTSSEILLSSLEGKLKSLNEMEKNRARQSAQKQRQHRRRMMMSGMMVDDDEDSDVNNNNNDDALLSPLVSGG